MGEWLWWVLGTVCGALAAVKLIGGAWCLIEFRRRWRTVPELWGIDWLDIVYRLEREFGVGPTAADFADVPANARTVLTAGQLWELVAARLAAANAEVPADGWERVAAVLSEALNVRPERVTAESRLYADLGMVSGLE